MTLGREVVMVPRVRYVFSWFVFDAVFPGVPRYRHDRERDRPIVAEMKTAPARYRMYGGDWEFSSVRVTR